LIGLTLFLILAAHARVGRAATPAAPPEPGAVVWYDLLTEDGEAALGFYRELFGWETVQHRDGGWVILHHGRPIGGVSEVTSELADLDEGLWLVGIAVDDVDTAVARALELGATIDVRPENMPGFARYAVVTDREDAPVLLVDPEIDMGGTEGHGSFVWTELWTRSPSVATAFYHRVVGFEQDTVEVNGHPYTVMTTAETHRAGLVATPLDTIEPAWVPYIGVTDLAAILDRVPKLGGQVLVGPHPEFANGSVALLVDPTGAAFFTYNIGGIGEVTQ
jgi:predicted enzyme related to lactoylglutathione lyase